MIFFGVCGTLFTYPIFTALADARSSTTAFALVMAALVIVTGYTSINAIVKAELFPADIRALGVALPYAIANTIFGGTAEYVALWLKDIGHERWFYFYISLLCLHLPDRLHPHARDQDHQPDRGGLMADTQTAKRSGSSLLPMLVAVLLIPAALGSSHTIFNDGDVSWHIASGPLDPRTRPIPTTDPFSFTWMGKHWVPFEWLADVIYASGYRLAGYAGVSALATAALMALNAIVYFNAARWIRPVLVGFGLLIVMNVVLIPMLLARPHLFVWPLLAAWMWVLMRAREKDRAPPLPAALLMSLWANLHGSFVFGLAIAAAFGLEALISSADRIRAFRQWLLFGVACAIAVCINANGLDGALYPFKYTDLEMLPMIDEWKPSSASVTPFFFVTLAIIAVLIVWKRPRLHPVRWLLLAACLGAALLPSPAPGDVRHRRRNDPSGRFGARAAARPRGGAANAGSHRGSWGSAAPRGALVHAADAARKSDEPVEADRVRSA